MSSSTCCRILATRLGRSDRSVREFTIRQLRIYLAALAAGTAFWSTAAAAGTVDLRFLPGNFDQFEWGQPNTTLYSQSVIADDSVFSEFRVGITAGTDDIDFNIVISGDRADGGGGLGFAPDFNDIRFTSPNLQVLTGAGTTEFTINPNIAVAPGERLFITMNTATMPAADETGTVRATEFEGTEQYPAGEFVFLNAGPQPNLQVAAINDVPWDHRSPENEDLAILAVFVPEPSTSILAALGLVGLPALAWWRRSRSTGRARR